MPDEGKSQWVRLVRARLSPLGLEGPREAEIVEELAEHLEEAFEESLALGRTERDTETQRHSLLRYCFKLCLCVSVSLCRTPFRRSGETFQKRG
jgi:hypothetical protein